MPSPDGGRQGQRTVRENVEDLIDTDSFVEYGPLVVAAQRQRRGLDDLLTRSPADGLVTGVGKINGDLFDDPDARAAVMAMTTRSSPGHRASIIIGN